MHSVVRFDMEPIRPENCAPLYHDPGEAPRTRVRAQLDEVAALPRAIREPSWIEVLLFRHDPLAFIRGQWKERDTLRILASPPVDHFRKASQEPLAAGWAGVECDYEVVFGHDL